MATSLALIYGLPCGSPSHTGSLDACASAAYCTYLFRTEQFSDMTQAPTPRRTKSDRLEIRLEAEHRALLDKAAAASAMSVSSFVLSHATDAARAVLADRTTFELPEERWDSFVELLDRDAKPMPGLAALLARPSVLEE